jgi:hypothetical protein
MSNRIFKILKGLCKKQLDQLVEEEYRNKEECLDEYRFTLERMLEIKSALLLDDRITTDMSTIPDSYLEVMNKYLERTRLRLLSENAKQLVDKGQIYYRNGAILTISLLQEKVQKGITGNKEEFNDLTREKIEPTSPTPSSSKRRG